MSRVQIGYAAMSTQHHPRDLVAHSEAAERAGFSGTMVADHFQPWLPTGGHAPYVWNVLSAVAARTTGDIGPAAVCPSFKVHPAVVAQASATLAALHPGRHWLGLSSGEALNEHIVGAYWPEPAERLTRMWEAVEIIRKLFSGKEVRHRGEHFRLEKTRLWTLDERPPIYVATAGPVTARRAGREVDGMITPATTVEKVAGLVGRFDEGAREAGRDPGALPKILQLHLSWAPTDEEALGNAVTLWPNEAIGTVKADIRSPHDFEQLARLVGPADIRARMPVSADPDVHRAHIQRFLDAGIDRVYLHNVGPGQREWIDVFARDVLPHLHR